LEYSSLRLQFKKEVALLLLAISLFAIGTFFYTYQAAEATSLAASIIYPYRSLALAFVGIGFASMVVASISYQRKTKNVAKELAA
jgi:uncharacterized protein (UPF0333 family)